MTLLTLTPLACFLPSLLCKPFSVNKEATNTSEEHFVLPKTLLPSVSWVIDESEAMDLDINANSNGAHVQEVAAAENAAIVAADAHTDNTAQAENIVSEDEYDDDNNEKEEKEEEEATALIATQPETTTVATPGACTPDDNNAGDTGVGGDCPICLSNDETIPLAFGPCHHECCVECWEHILNIQAEPRQAKGPSEAHLSAPTLGRCPICRLELSLFDLFVNVVGGDNGKDAKEQSNEEEVAEEEMAVKDDDNRRILHPPFMEYHEQSIQDCPLLESVYIPYRGKIGQLSFHWDWHKLKKNSMAVPFLNATETIQKNPHQWRLDKTGQLVPSLMFFDPQSCHFHSQSRTFHAKISFLKRFNSRLNGSHTWNIVLGFPNDYRFLSSGRIHMLKDFTPVALLTDHEDVHKNKQQKIAIEYYNKLTADEQKLCRYPLDGRWTVTWTKAAADGNDDSGNQQQQQPQEQKSEIHVKNNTYEQSGWTFYLNLDADPCHPVIPWPKSKHYQRAERGVNLIQQPLGPKAGEKIYWKTTSPKFPGHIVWERQTVGPLPMPKVISFGMGTGKILYQKLNAKTQDAIPKHNIDSLWGNVFCKRLHVGSASYHFLAPDNSYISYQHPACRDLPPLDDGTPLPTRVDFHNLEFDLQTRKLTCTIDWEEDFGTSWNDNVKWTLTMYFDSEYMIILKGGIQCEWCHERRARPRPPRPQNQHRPAPVPVYVPPPPPQPETPDEPAPPPPTPERNEEWVMSGYGHDQLYINAASLERYRSNNNASANTNIDYKEIFRHQCERLEGEGATKRSIGFLKHVFDLAAARPNSNPIDFLL